MGVVVTLAEVALYAPALNPTQARSVQKVKYPHTFYILFFVGTNFSIKPQEAVFWADFRTGKGSC